MESCKSRTEYYHRGGVSDEDLAPLLNKLALEKWEEIEWEKEKEEKEVHCEVTYRVDAQREICMCKPARKKKT